MSDEEMENEDLPEHEREKKPIDIEKIDMSDPITVVAETKKGQGKDFSFVLLTYEGQLGLYKLDYFKTENSSDKII